MSTTTSTDFNLHAYVSTVIAQSNDRDPHTIAARIATELEQPDLRPALEQALILYVRQTMTHEMGRARDVASSIANGTASRWATASNAYKQALSVTVVVSGDRKAFGDCSSGDLRYLAQVREETARATAKEAMRFKLFDKALEKHEASTVGDLPEAVVLELMHWEPKA